MKSFLATADWHLGIRPYSLLRRELDFYKSAKQIIESLKSDSIIFNAGDIFDTARPKFEAIRCLKDIHDEGFIESIGHGDHNVGDTLESLLGIETNSSILPDYKGIELKTTRSSFGKIKLTVIKEKCDKRKNEKETP